MKYTVITLLICLSFLSANAQYRKMPFDTNHYWQERWGHVGSFPSDFNDCTGTYMVTKDTLINGKVFKFVVCANALCSRSGAGYDTKIIRDDTIRKVVTFMSGQQEKILYNFNKNLGDTVYMLTYSGMGTLTVTAKDSVLLNDGLYHKRFRYSDNYYDPIIEGVGSLGGLFNNWGYHFEDYSWLLCVGQIYPPAPIYSSEGLGKICPNLTDITKVPISTPAISIYPNPSNNLITISCEGTQLETIEIVNLLGQTLLKQSVLGSNSVDVNLSSYAPGMYIVQINTEKNRTTRSFFKN